jgi:uncharacterized protein (DUF697 family)
MHISWHAYLVVCADKEQSSSKRRKSTVPRWSGLGTVFSTLREIDVSAIRDESEQDITIACFGPSTLINQVSRLLHTATFPDTQLWQGANMRYGPSGAPPLQTYKLSMGVSRGELQRADMLLLVLDSREPPDPAANLMLESFAATSLPFLVVTMYGDTLPLEDSTGALQMMGRAVAITDPHDPAAAATLASALLGRLPAEIHLAAARRLPGMRWIVARDLIHSTSFSNGTYALVSGISEQFPVLNLTIAAADVLVLTKNQVLMMYKLALAYGAPSDFQGFVREIVSVIGLAYLWRQTARSLVGLIPGAGIVPKVAVSYAGTYTIGVAAWRWFATGELVSQQQLQQIAHDALERGKVLADSMREQVSSGSKTTAARVRRMLGRSDRAVHE